MRSVDTAEPLVSPHDGFIDERIADRMTDYGTR